MDENNNVGKQPLFLQSGAFSCIEIAHFSFNTVQPIERTVGLSSHK